MRRNELAELTAFAAVVEYGSFTRGAAHLGLSAPTLSQTIRSLEERLDLRLINRTTRSVAPTEAGEALYARLRPLLGELEAAVESIGPFRDRQAGTLRINLSHMAARFVMAPLIAPFLETFPQIKVDLTIDDGITDIVAGGFDAGVRLGELVQADMVAVKLGGDKRLVAVASPAYLAAHGIPRTPRDLMAHRCVTWRGVTTGELYRWEFEKDGRDIRVAVDGPLIVNDFDVALRAARDGAVIAYLLEELVAPSVATGELIPVLDDWSVQFPGFHLYYPSRRLAPPPLRAFVDFARRRTDRDL
jgi:DNA-binding transcriptional LysR family regulator